mmetsp:Transcript_77085/g.136001  ORF Transcript_77085/g.136001 Transcript_77085/m.136001 type:complete len:85 (-) Transcript_77085:912-1166(-)
MTRLALPKLFSIPNAAPTEDGGARRLMSIGTTGPISWKPKAQTEVMARKVSGSAANPFPTRPITTVLKPATMDLLNPTRLKKGL